MNLSTDDLTGLNDLISHHNLSDFNDLDCLFDLKKIWKMLWIDVIRGGQKPGFFQNPGFGSNPGFK